MELKVGDERKFSFSKKDYEIKEILENPDVSMDWTWSSGICPHCKKKIETTINHTFHKIEILANKDKKEIGEDDLIIMGETIEGRRLIIYPIEVTKHKKEKAKELKDLSESKFIEIMSKSNKKEFRNLGYKKNEEKRVLKNGK